MAATCRFEAGQLVRLVRTIELFGGDMPAGSIGAVCDAWIENRGELLNVGFGPNRDLVICSLTTDDVESIEARPPQVPTAPATALRKGGTLWD